MSTSPLARVLGIGCAGSTKPQEPYEKPREGDEYARAARQAIDEKIASLEEKILSLRRDRNKFASTSILPAEVLSKIFVLIRDGTMSEYCHRQQSLWIRAVAHICHHWREVAIKCPSLWSIPPFWRPRLAQEMMDRSKMAALTVRTLGDSWSSKMVEQLESAMTQVFRIQALDLTFAVHPDKLKNILVSLTQPAPLLEEVALSKANYSPFEPKEALPLTAFADAPRLQSIELDKVTFSWQAAIFRHQTVTVLRLRHNRISPDRPTGFSEMLGALANMPNLRTLTLSYVIPLHATASDNETILPLNSLELLHIDGRATECAQFLRCIRYPPRTKVNLHASAQNMEEWMSIISLIGDASRHTPGTNSQNVQIPPTIREAVLELPFDEKSIIRLYERPIFSTDCVLYEPLIQVELYGDFLLLPDQSLKDVFGSFDLLALEKLTLNVSPGSNQVSTLRNCIGNLPKLKHVDISGCVLEFCLAFKESLQDREASPVQLARGPTQSSGNRGLQVMFPPVTVFPAFRTFQISLADFSRSRFPSHLDTLLDMLMQRSDMNSPIDMLILDGCRGLQSSYRRKQLKEIVVDLVIDGEEIDFTELDSSDEWSDEELGYSDEEYDDEEGYWYSDSDEHYDDSYFNHGASWQNWQSGSWSHPF